jgi:carbon monoxide dehydrogenase subunit G
MATIHNEITVNASIDKVWSMLTDLELLGQYDSTVKKSTLVSSEKTVLMLDGKNWFDEKVTVFKTNEALTYQLTDCSFPIAGVKHSNSFEKVANQTKVKQIMEYSVKFGLLGKLLNSSMIRKQSDTGIKKFFTGLKSHAETH